MHPWCAPRRQEDLHELCGRLQQDETPVPLTAKVFAVLQDETGEPYFQNWVATGSGKDITWWYFQPKPFGGLWERTDKHQAQVQLEDLVFEALCQVLGCGRAGLSKKHTSGPFSASVVGRLAGRLYQGDFEEKLDSPKTWHLIQFSCGRVLDVNTMAVRAGRREDMISRNTGYPYPEAQLADLRAKHDLEALFTRIVGFEALLSQLEDYPAAIKADLDALLDDPAFTLLKLLHTCWDAPGHGWPLTLYRIIKFPAASLLGMPVERFCVDLGGGSNGKSAVLMTMETVMGTYAGQASEALMTTPPPPVTKPNPTLLDMKGLRAVVAPELEASKSLQAAWVKRLSDQSAEHRARDLYSRREISFRLRSVFYLASNLKVSFTAMDGGIMRRAVAVPYSITFKEKAQGELERTETPELKDPQFLREHIPGLLHLLLSARVFFTKGRGVELMPKAVIEETRLLLDAEFLELLKEFVATNMEACGCADAATFNDVLIKACGSYMVRDLRIPKRSVEEALAQLLEKKTAGGRRNLVKDKSTEQFLRFQRRCGLHWSWPVSFTTLKLPTILRLFISVFSPLLNHKPLPSS